MTDPFAKDDNVPSEVIAGYYVGWQRRLEIDSALFRVEYRFRCVTDNGHTDTSVGTQVGDYWEFELTGTQTLVAANWHAGEYRWDLVAVRLSDNAVAMLDSGLLRFFATADDRLTLPQLMIQKIDSLLSGKADADVESYSIKNRSLTKMSVKELLHWREYYLGQLGRQRTSTGAANNTIRVRWI